MITSESPTSEPQSFKALREASSRVLPLFMMSMLRPYTVVASARQYHILPRDPPWLVGTGSRPYAEAPARRPWTGVEGPETTYRRGRQAAERALALDDGLAEAHCMLAQLMIVGEFDWIGAEAQFKRALELGPSSADAYDLYGRMCAALERYDEAIAMGRRAQELDPLAHRSDTATTLIRAASS